MHRKLIVALTLFIGIAIFIFIFVSYYNNSKNNEIIRIGVSAPLSGPTAWWGEYVKQGIDIALEELPKEEREKVNIIWEDDQCSAQKGISTIQKLIFFDKVKYVLGPLCNEVSIPTESLFEDNRVISITTGLPNKVIADMGEYHFSFLPEIRFLMEELAKHAYSKGNREIAILSLEDSYGYENYVYFKQYFESYGGKVVAEEFFGKSDTDVRSQLTKIKYSQPDSILIVAYGPALINILKQMEELNLNIKDRYGINAFEAPSLLQETPVLAEGIIYPRPADKESRQSIALFTQTYEQKYGVENGVYTSNAYDSFKLLHTAINQCGYEHNECIIEKLSAVNNYSGANGLLSVDERGVGQYEGVMLKTVYEGRFVHLDV